MLPSNTASASDMNSKECFPLFQLGPVKNRDLDRLCAAPPGRIHHSVAQSRYKIM